MRPVITEKVERTTTLKLGDFVSFEFGGKTEVGLVGQVQGNAAILSVRSGNFWSGVAHRKSPLAGVLTVDDADALARNTSNMQILEPAEVPAAIAKALGVALPGAKPEKRYFVSIDSNGQGDQPDDYWYFDGDDVWTANRNDGVEEAGYSQADIIRRLEVANGFREVPAPPF